MRDILTPRERFGLLVIDEKPDRCNIMPLITSHAATVACMSLRDYYTNGEAMAKAQLIAIEEYRHDAISIFSEVGILAEAMGSEFLYPESDLPILKVPCLTKFRLNEIIIPEPKKTGRLPVYLEAIAYAYKAIGDRVPILAYVPAPFTTGMMLSEPSQFLMQTLRDPALVKQIMELGLNAAIKFSFEIINAGGLPIIVDPLASSSVISPRIYKDFALPYERALIQYLHRYDLDTILHICGDTEPILDLLPETKADLISIDRVSLSHVVDKLASKMRIIGNYDTSRLAFGNPRMICQEVKKMIEQGMKAKKGYIIATGCEVPIKTPIENVKALVRAAKEDAWYWA